MTAPTPTAATPEELAARIELVGTKATQEEIREDIAAAIRQHSEAQRAEIERLTAEVDRFRRGWGPTTPTERQLRRDNLWHARNYLDHIYSGLIELNPNNYTHDDVEEANNAVVEAVKEAAAGAQYINGLMAELAEGMTGQVDEGMSALEARATTAEAALAAVTAERDALAAEADSLRYDASVTRTLRDKAGKVCGAAQRLVYEMRNHVPSDAALPHASLELQAIRRAYDALVAALQPQETADV